MHDARKEVVQDDILIVEPDQLLNLRRRPARILRHHAVVEPKEQPLELRDDAVLVVARISDEGPPRVGIVARQVAGARIAAVPQGIPKEKELIAIVQVRLITRTASIDTVEIEGGST